MEFWVNADEQQYFKLFKLTFNAIKEVNSKFKIGGPAISGIEHEKWIKDFIDFCDVNELNIDFITRHIYASVEKQTHGHYSYFRLRDTDEVANEANVSRKIIDKNKKFKGIPLHITEFSSIYRPDSPLHDTVKNAAYVTDLVLKMMNQADSYSYWTFGDVFEEQGIPFSQFYGGFGLVANHSIPKPTFWAFKFIDSLYENCIHRFDHLVVTKNNSDQYRGIAWNYTTKDSSKSETINLKMPLIVDNNYCLVVHVVDKNHGNPLQVWHDLGDDPNPSGVQVGLLKQASNPTIFSSPIKNGKISLTLAGNAVIYFEVFPVKKILIEVMTLI